METPRPPEVLPPILLYPLQLGEGGREEMNGIEKEIALCQNHKIRQETLLANLLFVQYQVFLLGDQNA